MKAEVFLEQIRREFPEFRWKTYRYLTHGWDHFIIILDEKVVFRMPKDRRYRSEFQNEIQLLNYLKKRIRIDIPKYKYVSKDQSFAGYNMVRGKELTHSLFHRLSAAEKESLAKQLAEFITTLHKTPKPIIKKYSIRIEDQHMLHRKLVRDTRKILFSRFSQKDIKLIEKYFIELKTSLRHCYSNVLLHNDLTGEHILWDVKEKQVNIIDFSDRSFGDPASDFTGLIEYGHRFTERVLDLYGGQKTENMLCRSQLYFKRIPFFIMMDALQGYPCTFRQGYKMFKKIFKA